MVQLSKTGMIQVMFCNQITDRCQSIKHRAGSTNGENVQFHGVLFRTNISKYLFTPIFHEIQRF